MFRSKSLVFRYSAVVFVCALTLSAGLFITNGTGLFSVIPMAWATNNHSDSPERDQSYRGGVREYNLLLNAINEARLSAGVPEVVLGNNKAAQLHADDMLSGCFLSHWGTNGNKPYMRYARQGSANHISQSITGLGYCIAPGYFIEPNSTVDEEITEAVDHLLSDEVQRGNILDTNHSILNVGLAWDDYNLQVALLFESDYVIFQSSPNIEDGVFSMQGTVYNGVHFEGLSDLQVSISYDSLPHLLTRGQLGRTYCYDTGLRIATLRWRLPGNARWPSDEYDLEYKLCPNPYNTDPNASPASSPYEAENLLNEARSTYEES